MATTKKTPATPPAPPSTEKELPVSGAVEVKHKQTGEVVEMDVEHFRTYGKDWELV